VLGKANFVGVFWVRVVRVDGLRPVGVLGGLGHFGAFLAIVCRGGAGVGCWGEASRRVALGTGGSTRVSGHGGRSLEAAQLCRCVHLRGVACGHGLWAGTESTGHGAATAERAGLFLVQGE
jgi:hypothetical protein